MKPFEILSAIPSWANAASETILDSSAFLLECRLGDNLAKLRHGAVLASDTLDLAIRIGGQNHILSLARSKRFAELDKIWESRAEMPPALLLALVEKDCGAFLQMLENILRRQIVIAQIAGAGDDKGAKTECFEVEDILFSLTASSLVVSSLGFLRNLDLANEEIRSRKFSCDTQLASFALSPEDAANLAVGDALLLPEIGSLEPRLVVEGLFSVGEKGVERFSDDGFYQVFAAEKCDISLGQIFDFANGDASRVSEEPKNGAALRLVKEGFLVATGSLGRVGSENAFLIESIHP